MVKQCSKLTTTLNELDVKIASKRREMDKLQQKRFWLLDERRRLVVECYQQGQGIGDIARACNLSRQAISKMVKQTK